MYMKDISQKTVTFIGNHFVGFELIDDKKIAVADVVNFVIYEKAASALKAQKDFAAFVNVYFLILIFQVGEKCTKAFCLCSVSDCL